MERKKILLIGGTGQLGREIQNIAPDYNFDVWAPSKQEVDAVKESDVKAAILKWQPDILINTSAYQALSRCEEFPEETFLLNSIAVYRMAKLAKEHNLKFVTFSTNYVFSGSENNPISEDVSPDPLQIYGISKAAGEYSALAACPEQSFVIRTSALYGGARGSSSKGNFVLNIIKEAMGKESIAVSSEQIVNPTYAVDLAQAALKLLSVLDARPGIYHLVNEGFCSWCEFAEKILALSGIKTAVVGVDRKGFSGGAKRPLFAVLANTRARAYGIVLPKWQDGLSSYFTYLKRSN